MKVTPLFFDEIYKISGISTGINIEGDNNYFFLYMNIPKYMFNITYNEWIFSRYEESESEKNKLYPTNLELFGKGFLSTCPMFFFKPWIVNEGVGIDRFMENVVFAIPEYIFLSILELELRRGFYTWNQIKNIDVVKDIGYRYIDYGMNDLRGNISEFRDYDISELKNLDKILKIEIGDKRDIDVYPQYRHLLNEYYF